MSFWLSLRNRALTPGESIDIRLSDGSVLCKAILQSDGTYWWRDKFIDASEVEQWRQRTDE